MKLVSLDHALSLIKDRPEFCHNVKGDYSYIDYNYETDDTFYDEELRELRGLIYDSSGNLIRRPLPKFFNFGTKHAPKIDSINDWYSLEKLDGSMLAPFHVNGEHKLGTRAGETEVSKKADAFIKDKANYHRFLDEMHKVGLTPIFEYIGPDNRIVLDYKESNLILIAIRAIVTGDWVSYETLQYLGAEYDIPVVRKIHFNDLIELVSTVEGMEDEGFVLVHAHTNERVKIKSPHYCQIHKARSQILQEKDLIRLIIENKLDDVKPFLPKEDLDLVSGYEALFNQNLKVFIQDITCKRNKLFDSLDSVTRAEYAKLVIKEDPKLKTALFLAFDGRLDRDALIKTITLKLGSQSGVDEVRHIFNIPKDYLTSRQIIL
jgi:RNA ligase